MKAFITGGAGFIASNLADRLLQAGHEVLVYDNMCTGQELFINHNLNNPKYKFIKADVLDKDTLTKSMAESDFVFHFQANADVRGGITNTSIDLEQNIICTHNVLDAIRINKIKNIAFASSATVYGEPEIFPTPENIPLIQTSLYGASKASAENLIQAYCEYYGIKSWIFRFVSFVGQRYTHGVVFDFMKKLKENPTQLEILGNGEQKKSYLHVNDGIDAIMLAIENSNEKTNIFNLGNKEFMIVTDLADILCSELQLNNTKYNFTGGERGWIGDSPFVHLDVSKIEKLGWKPKFTVKNSIIDTIKYLKENQEIFELRK